jgi:hypothetical protein
MSDGSFVLSARETAWLIGRKELSPVEVVRRALDEAEATQATLNACTVLRREEALNEARAAEAGVMRGDALGALHGLPFAVKDLISVEGLPYAFGSRAMADNIGKVDAPSVERARAAGGDPDWQDDDERIRMQASRRQPADGRDAQPNRPQADPGGFERRLRRLGRRRDYPVRARRRRWRIDPHPRRLHGNVRVQGEFRPRAGLAGLGDADACARLPTCSQCPRRRAAPAGRCRLRPARPRGHRGACSRFPCRLRRAG